MDFNTHSTNNSFDGKDRWIRNILKLYVASCDVVSEEHMFFWLCLRITRLSTLITNTIPHQYKIVQFILHYLKIGNHLKKNTTSNHLIQKNKSLVYASRLIWSRVDVLIQTFEPSTAAIRFENLSWLEINSYLQWADCSE